MIRTFQQHRLRKSQQLDGLWDFVFDKNNVGLSEKWSTHFPSNPDRIPVPAVGITSSENTTTKA
ncbi:hypothetical protein MKX36_12545 [Paenibacillus sp. FSL W8-0439]|uniref:hypothetical protein n=1 Tax=Paenibacillus sp. FSL W8-0439 TaxID=2921716 RepID=UPI0030F50689